MPTMHERDKSIFDAMKQRAINSFAAFIKPLQKEGDEMKALLMLMNSFIFANASYNNNPIFIRGNRMYKFNANGWYVEST
jgi:hypothetical protein